MKLNGGDFVRKWILLFIGVAVLAGNSWAIYDMYQPRVGPIGNGKVATHVWVSIIINIVIGVFAIAQSIVLFVYEKKNATLLKKFPYLETEHFLLRRIEVSDANEVFQYFSHDEVTKYYDLDTFKDISEATRLIENWQKRFAKQEGIRWGIATKSDNKIIGSCGFHNWEKEHSKAEIGFEVTPEYWQQGVMSEVLKVVLPYGFEMMGLYRIEAFYDPQNTASKMTLEKVGFIYEGNLRKSSFEKGRYCDAAVCSILKEEYV